MVAQNTVDGRTVRTPKPADSFHRGPNVALTLEQVRNIRHLRKQGFYKHHIAERLGITLGLVGRVLGNKGLYRDMR
jgi:hypothetical protein